VLPCIGIRLAPSGESYGGNAGLAESNGSLLAGGWLKVTCGLTACTPGSVPGPTLGNEYGRTLLFQCGVDCGLQVARTPSYVPCAYVHFPLYYLPALQTDRQTDGRHARRRETDVMLV